ncbi:MAG: flagellar protein FlaG [Gammaproteobacteria bacterium]|nr:flagellar protein FlaG [Gammaproteobacteria bacterium]
MRQIRSPRANAPMRQDIPSGGEAVPAASEHRPLEPGDTRLDEAVSQLNDYIQSIHRNIEFTVDAALNRVVVRVYNRETEEILREIPAEEILDMPLYILKQKAGLSDMEW